MASRRYGLGSVLNHVLMHQSVIGEEALKQMDKAGEYPDVVIGCVGGGSNFAGIAYPFLRENLKNGQRTRLLAVEPTAVPSLTKGSYAFDYGDTAKMAPVVKMHTLGPRFRTAHHPRRRSALSRYGAQPVGFLRCRPDRRGFRPPASHLRSSHAIHPNRRHPCPAPESAHAIRAAIDEALDAKEKGEKRVILFNLSGHGHFDMASYQQYLKGNLQDYAHPADAIKKAMADLPKL